jgi:hypothetical protein
MSFSEADWRGRGRNLSAGTYDANPNLAKVLYATGSGDFVVRLIDPALLIGADVGRHCFEVVTASGFGGTMEIHDHNGVTLETVAAGRVASVYLANRDPHEWVIQIDTLNAAKSVIASGDDPEEQSAVVATNPPTCVVYRLEDCANEKGSRYADPTDPSQPDLLPFLNQIVQTDEREDPEDPPDLVCWRVSRVPWFQGVSLEVIDPDDFTATFFDCRLCLEIIDLECECSTNVCEPTQCDGDPIYPLAPDQMDPCAFPKLIGGELVGQAELEAAYGPYCGCRYEWSLRDGEGCACDYQEPFKCRGFVEVLCFCRPPYFVYLPWRADECGTCPEPGAPCGAC